MALLFVVCRRTADLGLAGAAAAAVGLILAHHCYANDIALLTPLLVLTMQRPANPRWLKAAAVLIFTPAPTLLITTQRPYLGQVLVAGFVIAALLMQLPHGGAADGSGDVVPAVA
jgi:hypothetical protein